jgi:hypothetical protein
MQKVDLRYDIEASTYTAVFGSIEFAVFNFFNGLGVDPSDNIYNLRGPYSLTRGLYRDGARVLPIVAGIYDTIPGIPAYLLGRAAKLLYNGIINKR